MLSRPGALLSLRRDIAYPMSRMVKGDKMVSRLSVFSTAFLFRILQYWSGLPLSRSWLAIALGVMFGELIGFLSSQLIFDIILIAFFVIPSVYVNVNNFEKFEVRLRSRLLPLLVHVILMFISVLKFSYCRDYCPFWYMLFYVYFSCDRLFPFQFPGFRDAVI